LRDLFNIGDKDVGWGTDLGGFIDDSDKDSWDGDDVEPWI